MKRIQWALATATLALFATAAHAAFLVSEKEVKRQARVEWLGMKRHVPLETDARIKSYVQCIADDVLAQLPPELRDEFEWEVAASTSFQLDSQDDKGIRRRCKSKPESDWIHH